MDKARAPREGEALDLDALRAFLATTGLEESLEEITQFPGGHSNLTYLLRFASGREVILRRPPFGSKVKRAHDMGREHRVLSALSEHCSWAPAPVAFCDDHSVIGADFYLMERIRGVILRRALPQGLTIADPTKLCETLIDTLVELHSFDPESVGLADLGRPDGYVERQVTGWTKRYTASKTDDIAEVPQVAEWLAANMPPSGAATIIHNDYKFDNVIYDGPQLSKIVGVLDWEMATIGDPLMDLGTSLCYWVEAGDSDAMKNMSFGPTTLPGMMTRAELTDRYAAKTGRDLSDIVFYYVFGLFKDRRRAAADLLPLRSGPDDGPALRSADRRRTPLGDHRRSCRRQAQDLADGQARVDLHCPHEGLSQSVTAQNDGAETNRPTGLFLAAPPGR